MNLPPFPDAPPDAPPYLVEWLEAVRQYIQAREGKLGKRSDRFVSEQQLIDAGVINAGDIP